MRKGEVSGAGKLSILSFLVVPAVMLIFAGRIEALFPGVEGACPAVSDSLSGGTEERAAQTPRDEEESAPVRGTDSLAGRPGVDSLKPEDSAGVPADTASPVTDAPGKTVEPPRAVEFSPKALRFNAIYLNAGAVANEALLDRFIERTRGTVIGGFVMDMKDDRGYLSYTSSLPLAAEARSSTRRVGDPAALVKKLHDNGLIASARVVAFKDPLLASYAGADSSFPYAVLDSVTGVPWEQHNGERWINPQDDRVHDYLTGIVDELLGFGFDQVQMDYIRFPSDGDMGRIFYPVTVDSLKKADMIGMFLSKVRDVVDRHDASLSVDVFGWVPWLRRDRDYWIGQDYDIIASHSDVICPMLYCSHFPKSFKAEYGARRAYHIVREGTAKGVERRGARLTGVQPYIQAFNWQSPHFGTRYIIEQMQAAEEAGAVGWILWNARNDYSESWKALEERYGRADRGEE